MKEASTILEGEAAIGQAGLSLSDPASGGVLFSTTDDRVLQFFKAWSDMYVGGSGGRYRSPATAVAFAEGSARVLGCLIRSAKSVAWLGSGLPTAEASSLSRGLVYFGHPTLSEDGDLVSLKLESSAPAVSEDCLFLLEDELNLRPVSQVGLEVLPDGKVRSAVLVGQHGIGVIPRLDSMSPDHSEALDQVWRVLRDRFGMRYST